MSQIIGVRYSDHKGHVWGKQERYYLVDDENLRRWDVTRVPDSSMRMQHAVVMRDHIPSLDIPPKLVFDMRRPNAQAGSIGFSALRHAAGPGETRSQMRPGLEERNEEEAPPVYDGRTVFERPEPIPEMDQIQLC